MKRSISRFVKGATLALLVLVSQSMAFAVDIEPAAVKKARAAVSSSPDNWYILAQSAETCFKNHLNIEEAGEWIEKSLSLQKNSYTMEVMGDYYMETDKPDKAIGYYVGSLEMTKKRNPKAKLTGIQAKVAKAVKAKKSKG